jgi:hypothetical protein
MNPLNTLFDDLQDVVNDCQTDVTKFIDGNNSAGTRVRKAMQAIKAIAQEVRVEVQDQKNKQF